VPYDAILLVSFGGPEGPDDVMPFLENVLRGRNVPRERMLEVAEHYAHFGGKSPINDQCRAFLAALRERLAADGPNLPVYWGNRNWHPMLADTVRQMAADGVQRALAYATSAYASYSGCRQYRENIEAARMAVGPGAPVIDKLRPFHDHPLFVEATAARVGASLERLPGAHVVYTAHSIPMSMASTCRYEEQLRETGGLVAQRLGFAEWDLVWQSRSGPPSVAWLAPDICDHLRSLRMRGVGDVVIAPIGFLSDHVEVLYDLDTEAAGVAAGLGMRLVRAETVGTHPAMVELIRQLVAERVDAPEIEKCPADCCPAAVRPAGQPR
jgi:protoporphyrin/coproporphyrin ferrochelatase